jgi:hypothetical protein
LSKEVALQNLPESDKTGDLIANWGFNGNNIVVYPASDGSTHCALRREDGSYDLFLSVDEGQYWDLMFFYNLFGQDGFWVEYGLPSGDGYDSVRSYYAFTSSGGLTEILRVSEENWGEAQRLDLDGNGADELIRGSSVYYWKDGSIYYYDFDLISSYLPGGTIDGLFPWDAYGRYCAVTGRTDDGQSWSRYLYFDDGKILIYNMDDGE